MYLIVRGGDSGRSKFTHLEQLASILIINYTDGWHGSTDPARAALYFQRGELAMITSIGQKIQDGARQLSKRTIVSCMAHSAFKGPM